MVLEYTNKKISKTGSPLLISSLKRYYHFFSLAETGFLAGLEETRVTVVFVVELNWT